MNLTKTKIILVDDFVGTGETAEDVVNFIHVLMPNMTNNDSVKVLCIAAMQAGIERLDKMGVTVYSDMVMKKAISDTLQGPQKDEAIAMMQSIESGLRKLRPEDSFGYGQSESLICMERCPNNTFPVYWLTKGVAPYER